MVEQKDSKALKPYLSQAGLWAFALGAAIGWGSLVVTSNSYLMQAGPWGSILGLLIGAAVMVVIARNYHYMINCFPDAGGVYTYSKEAFGHDFGFLAAWFAGLTYIAILWANATSLPLFAHYFLGDIFKFGFLYTVFGYDVYVGEILLTLVAMALVALLLMRSRIGTMRFMVGMAVVLTVGIVVCYIGSAMGFSTGGGATSLEPGFLPDESVLGQVVLIASISPWAFVGFENVSHSAEEFAFPRSKVFRVLLAAIATATVLYIFVLLMSIMAFPPQFDSWLEYIANRSSLSGIEGLPPFYVAHHYLGDAGVVMLMVVLLCLVITSLIAQTMALSRLFYALGKDDVLPKRFARVSERHIPTSAVLLVLILSLVIPFLGRTAVGWIVDVTNIGATIVFGFVSAATFKVARARGDGIERATGIIGLIVMIFFGAYLLIPSLLLTGSLEPESYFLFALWGILGFLLFRVLLGRDGSKRFGRSVVVWISLLALVMFVVVVWMNQSLVGSTQATIDAVHSYYFADGMPTVQQMADHEFVEAQLLDLKDSDLNTILLAASLLVLAPLALLSGFTHLSRWARKSEAELDETRNIVYTDPLTGLPSMTRFYDIAERGAVEIDTRGERAAAVAMDLVGMRDYNTEHGRDSGDRLLVLFADVLRKHFGEENCSRFAEDHFYAFAPEREVAEKLEAVFSDFKELNEGSTLPIRAGVYVCNAVDEIVSVGFDRARTACDQDRRTWQSHATWFIDGMSDEARMRLHVLDHVDQAIEERWVRPYYQAVVDTTTRRVCSEEALARWIDPEYGALSPGRFIPILEDAGLLYKVDIHIIKCVIEDMATKKEAGVPIVPVSVNISLRDISHLDLVADISGMMDDIGLPHSLLRIEFTESAASDDPELFRTEVNVLRKAGFEVWMDDFGSGYSSLNSLKDFDFDVVKLDMQFLRGDHGEKTWDIISGVVDITKKIGMRTLAEGIETPEQSHRLEIAGCDMLQGYYYARPQPLEEITKEVQAGTSLERNEPSEAANWTPTKR